MAAKKNLLLILSLFPLMLTAQSGNMNLKLEPESLLLEKGIDSVFFAEGAKLSISNLRDEEADLILIVSREELLCLPTSVNLLPGDTVEISLRFVGTPPDSEEMFFPLIILDRESRASRTWLIYHPDAYIPDKNADREGDLILTYYYSPSCKSCREFLEKEIPRLEQVLHVSLGLELRNIFEEENMVMLKEHLAFAGIETDELPVLEIGDIILAGEGRITKWLEPALRGEPVPDGKGQGSEGDAPLWLLVTGAGLLDGINPCAFSTLIFLLAYLGLRKRTRREILSVGIVFTLTVFITYTAVGAGAFLILRESVAFPLVSSLLKWGGAALLSLLALLSLRDYIRVRRGDTSEITLQLSPAVKRAVHKSVRNGVRSAVPTLGAAAMGFTVTIYELGCTGQIYLPTLYLMTQRGEGKGYLLLLLYNLTFIIPLAAVFFLAYRGLASDKLSEWFKERLGAVKLITMAFFIAAAVLILIVA